VRGYATRPKDFQRQPEARFKAFIEKIGGVSGSVKARAKKNATRSGTPARNSNDYDDEVTKSKDWIAANALAIVKKTRIIGTVSFFKQAGIRFTGAGLAACILSKGVNGQINVLAANNNNDALQLIAEDEAAKLNNVPGLSLRLLGEVVATQSYPTKFCPEGSRADPAGRYRSWYEDVCAAQGDVQKGARRLVVRQDNILLSPTGTASGVVTLIRPAQHLLLPKDPEVYEEEEWYRGVKGFKFDGWSFAGGVGVNGGPYRILNRLLIMRDQKLLDPGLDWLHLLMLSQFPWAPMMTAVQRGVRKFVKNKKFTVSYDSSTPYRMGGQYEKYFEARPFTSDPRTWSNWDHKLPSTYGFGSQQFALNTTVCSRNKCAMCARGKQHLLAPFTSPIAKKLYMTDLVTNKNNHARRRVGRLFEKTLINSNVFTVVDGIIRANEALFDAKPHAPQQLIDAVGIIKDDLFRVENWRGLLNKKRSLLEEAVGFKAGKDVL
jgi:hypothetical protein